MLYVIPAVTYKQGVNKPNFIILVKYISMIYKWYLIISRTVGNRWYICSNNFLQTKYI